jgi:hypothetical protein
MVNLIKKATNPGEVVKKPSCIVEYNKFMKGVDRANQYTRYSNGFDQRDARKWLHKHGSTQK